MAFKIPSAVRETTITVGTGDLLLAGAVDGSYSAFGAKLADGDTTLVTVKKTPNREVFVGTYNAGPNTISRTRMLLSTNGGSPVNWGAGTKDIYVANVGSSDLDAAAKAAILVLLGADFPSSTTMTFQQASAPVGWVKQVTHDDKALRVVSGTPGSGGSSPFSTVFAKTGTDAHGLTAAEVAPHTHGFSGTTGTDSPDHGHSLSSGQSGTPQLRTDGNFQGFNYLNTTGATTTGGASARHAHGFSGNTDTGAGVAGNGHTHGMDIRVQYVDLILATKS